MGEIAISRVTSDLHESHISLAIFLGQPQIARKARFPRQEVGDPIGCNLNDAVVAWEAGPKAL